MINKLYNERKTRQLSALKALASKCTKITETQVGDTTLAFFLAQNEGGRLISYGYDTKEVDMMNNLKLKHYKTWNYRNEDIKTADIEYTDMLYIADKNEIEYILSKHSSKVKKYIVFPQTDINITNRYKTNRDGLTILSQVNDEIELLSLANYKPSGAKITLYTANYGGIDRLKLQPKQTVKIDYVCFTDNPHIQVEEGAEKQRKIIYHKPHEHLHPRMQAKYFRTHPYEFFDTEICIWMDSSGRLLKKNSIEHFVKQMKKNSDVITFKHPERNCIYDEMAFCELNPRAQRKYKGLPLREQVEHYLSKGYPLNYGLSATGMQITKRDNKVIREFFHNRWTENLERTYQDQLSYDYLVWKHRIKRQRFQENQRFNDYISYSEDHLIMT